MDNKYSQQFKKGSLEMMLLCLIGRKETYGYEIITELNRRGADVLGYAKEGTVYPILYRLEDAGLLACRMAEHQRAFLPGDGIVGEDVAETVRHVGVLASEGMRETDRVILNIMAG